MDTFTKLLLALVTVFAIGVVYDITVLREDQTNKIADLEHQMEICQLGRWRLELITECMTGTGESVEWCEANIGI